MVPIFNFFQKIENIAVRTSGYKIIAYSIHQDQTSMFKQFTKIGSFGRTCDYNNTNPFILASFARIINDGIRINSYTYNYYNETPFIFMKHNDAAFMAARRSVPVQSRKFRPNEIDTQTSMQMTSIRNTLNVFGKPYWWSVFQNVSEKDTDTLIFRSWVNYSGKQIHALTLVENVDKQAELDPSDTDPSIIDGSMSYYELINTPDWYPQMEDFIKFGSADKVIQKSRLDRRIRIV